MSVAAVRQCFEIVERTDYNLVKFTDHLTSGSAQSFVSAIPLISGTPVRSVVLDLEFVNELPMSWVRSIMQLNQKLKGSKQGLRLIQVSDEVVTFLKREGLEGTLKACPSLSNALVEMGLSSSQQLDVNFINPFLRGAVSVLEMQAMTEAKPGKLYLKKAHEGFLGEITGIINMVSPAFTGAIAISFPATTFLKIMSRMLGEEQIVLTKDIEDGAAELTNMIFGQAKVELNRNGHALQTALPSVVTGPANSALRHSRGPRVIVPFITDTGEFFIDISLSE